MAKCKEPAVCEKEAQQGSTPGPPHIGTAFEVPDCLRVPFTLHGYRVNYSPTCCACSIFGIHNEFGTIPPDFYVWPSWTSKPTHPWVFPDKIDIILYEYRTRFYIASLGRPNVHFWNSKLTFLYVFLVNIWTHLGPCIAYLVAAANWVRETDFTGPTASGLEILPVIYCLSAAITWGCSSLFHTFSCISSKVFFRLRLVDFLGISSLILASVWASIILAMQCYPKSLAFYSFIYLALSTMALVTPCLPFFQNDSLRVLRTSLYVGLAIGPFFMGMQLIWMQGGISKPTFAVLYSRIYYAYFTYGLGVFFYASRVPERFWPGRFDYIGHSHQLWHICVAAASYIYYVGIVNYMPLAHKIQLDKSLCEAFE